MAPLYQSVSLLAQEEQKMNHFKYQLAIRGGGIQNELGEIGKCTAITLALSSPTTKSAAPVFTTSLYAAEEHFTATDSKDWVVV